MCLRLLYEPAHPRIHFAKVRSSSNFPTFLSAFRRLSTEKKEKKETRIRCIGKCVMKVYTLHHSVAPEFCRLSRVCTISKVTSSSFLASVSGTSTNFERPPLFTHFPASHGSPLLIGFRFIYTRTHRSWLLRNRDGPVFCYPQKPRTRLRGAYLQEPMQTE